MDDTSAPGLDPKVRLLASTLGTRSLLVVPVILNGSVLGLVGYIIRVHPRVWLDEEVSFLQSIAKQLAIGYQYTRLFTDKQREGRNHKSTSGNRKRTERTLGFWQGVTSLVLERAVAMVHADYCALGVVDPNGGRRITLAAFIAAPHAETENVRGLIDVHGKSLDISEYPALMDVLAQGKTFRLLDTELPFPFRLGFNAVLGGRAALVAPVRVGGQTFGLLGLVWSDAREGFDDQEVALVEGNCRSDRHRAGT